MKDFPLTVIIANYNSGFFLKKCIDSINGSKKIPSEIIIVDDKSTDNSLKLAEMLKKKNSNIKIISKYKNQGAAEARYTALRKIKNKIISYIDADDFIENGALYSAYKKLIKTKSDICLFKLFRYEDGRFKIHSANPSKKILTGKEAAEETLGKWGIHFLGVFRKDLFLNAYNYLNIKKKLFNADELIARLFFNSSTKVVTTEKKYFYRSNKSSTTNKRVPFAHKDNLYKLEELISYLWVIKFAKNNYNHLLYPCVRWGVSLAYKIWKQRKIISSVKTKIELKKFLNAITNEIRLITFLKNSPLHFFIFFFLKLNLSLNNE
jgi:glycosyltransferase involved in cell wall biosynthesis